MKTKKLEKILWEIQFDEILKYYSQGFYCANCGDHTTIYILKGVRKDTLLVECQECGCSSKP